MHGNSCNDVHAERERLARKFTSVATREQALVQRQAEQASAAEEEEARLVKEAQALDAQRADLQAQLAEAEQGISHSKFRVLACASTPDAPSHKPLPEKDLFLTKNSQLFTLDTSW